MSQYNVIYSVIIRNTRLDHFSRRRSRRIQSFVETP